MKRQLTAILAVAILAASIATSTASAAPPQALLLTGPRATTAATSANFTFIVLNRRLNQLSAVECVLDGVPGRCTSLVSPSPRWLQLILGRSSYAGLLPGRHTFELRLTETTGLVTSVSRTWTILGPPPPPPLNAPTVSITGGPPISTGDTTATFQFALGGGPADSVVCDLDGAVAPCTSPATYPGLALGAHTFTVTATNTTGSSSDTRTWTIIGSE